MTEEKFVFDLNRVKYSEIQGLMMLRDQEAEEATINLVTRCLVSWPYDLEINGDNIRNLGLVDFIELQKAFNAELENTLKSE